MTRGKTFIVSGPSGVGKSTVLKALMEKRIGDIAEEIAHRKDVRFVMIAGPSSSGKTTTAMALATAAARHNRNVSVLDTDPQGDATTWAGDAEDAGETLPFTVDSANIGKLKRLRKTMADDELVIIDCPPAGNVVDVACDVADFVIVPATQGPFELSHALETAESLDAAGKPYALLLLKVENNKLAGNAVNLIRERGASVFDASVPKRVGMQKVIGHAFPSNLNGYEDVYLELEEAIA